jgi:hypothetical protein
VYEFSDHFDSASVLSGVDLHKCLLTLKIVAKFLGYVESLPYHYRQDSTSNKLMAASLQQRQKVRKTFRRRDVWRHYATLRDITRHYDLYL